MSLEDLKKKAKELGIVGVSKRGRFTKHNKAELEETILKAETSGCRILTSVKDLDVPCLKNVSCEDLCETREKFEKTGLGETTGSEGVFNAGMAFVGFGFLVVLGAGSWYFFPSKNKSEAKPDIKKHYEQHI